MGHLITSGTTSGAGFTGEVHEKADGSTVPTAEGLPAGITGRNLKPCLIRWKRWIFLIGQFSRPLIRCENRNYYEVGLYPPVGVPTMTPGTGSGGFAGKGIGYLTFRHKINGAIIHESNPSPPSAELDCTGAGRIWSGLPTSDPHGRATHLVGYLKCDEFLPREAFEIPLGGSTVEENTQQLSLGKDLSFRRGVPPYTMFAAPYHDRMWYTGDPLYPFRWWYSELGEPESVHPLNYYDTRDRDAVTGIAAANEDQLVVFTKRQNYDVQGYRGADAGITADFNVRKVDPSIGCISHHSIVNIHNRLFFAAERGLAVWDGAPRYISTPFMNDFWFEDYEANVDAYEKSWAFDDDTKNIYKLCINRPSSPKSFYYIVNYNDIEPITGFAQLGRARISFDIRGRQDSAGAMMPALESSRLRAAFTGSCDGLVREENADANADDDGDSWQKKWTVQPGHSYFEEVGGDKWHGKRFVGLGVILKNEVNAATLKMYPGDDSAPEGQPPPTRGTLTIPAGADAGNVARMDYFLRPYITGEGLSIRIEVLAPLGCEYGGWYGEWIEGLRSRGQS